MEPLNDNRVPFQPSFVLVALSFASLTSTFLQPRWTNYGDSFAVLRLQDQTPLACDRTPGQDAKQVTPRSEPIPDRAMLGSDPLPMQASSHLAAPALQHALTTRLTTSH
ncbi:hypothetical protein JMJ77_0001920 [Colletotrichum scovillei]|uniref:Uncharacterized protein n=1 Tax=Colletotrichum scovillei TaxID=1209932 RepID=A0A9P7R6W5_9PEZI|nr:hypothetical protein JMJ77_0001920 [Colletotrichum scovillei]KAG7070331.1 hypothetical protein JMJ76_0001586 [Colletotrichum scovillei]KAG7078582.1 hypothetical protein JMJ78_0002252 [Colletotrichum scovillei]